MWGQLAIKALVSGVLIALASELARRNPGWLWLGRKWGLPV